MGQGEGRRGGAPAARHGGRRGLLCRRGGALLVDRACRRAQLGAREGGGQLVLVRSRPELVARCGGLRWRARVESGAAAWRDAEGQRPFMVACVPTHD
jgi:hypothetical protein